MRPLRVLGPIVTRALRSVVLIPPRTIALLVVLSLVPRPLPLLMHEVSVSTLLPLVVVVAANVLSLFSLLTPYHMAAVISSVTFRLFIGLSARVVWSPILPMLLKTI